MFIKHNTLDRYESSTYIGIIISLHANKKRKKRSFYFFFVSRNNFRVLFSSAVFFFLRIVYIDCCFLILFFYLFLFIHSMRFIHFVKWWRFILCLLLLLRVLLLLNQDVNCLIFDSIRLNIMENKKVWQKVSINPSDQMLKARKFFIQHLSNAWENNTHNTLSQIV